MENQGYALIAISIFAALFVLSIFCKPKPKMGDMTLAELASIHKADGRLLIGCKSKIYDVTANEMYAPGQTYFCFVGRDASVALAKMKFDAEFLDSKKLHWSKDLNKDESKILDDWDKKFQGKYKVVGMILDDLKNN